MRAVALIVLLAAPSVAAQQPAPARPPAPPGQDIVARDGDRIVVEDDARIEIVRRRAATVRTVFNSAERWLIVLVDYAQPGQFPDGNVDIAYRYTDLGGAWPMGERWEGLTTVEEYFPVIAFAPVSRGIGVVTPAGVVQLLPPAAAPDMAPVVDSRASAVLTFRGASTSGIGRKPPVGFDQAEREQITQAANNATFHTSSGISATGGSNSGPSGTANAWISAASSAAPVRADFNTSGSPRKIRDVTPVYPQGARAAGVRGIVLLEATIAADGSVTDVRVLRSIPLLDQAAIDAVRQWQYEPHVVNGTPKPVRMTMAVPVYPN